MAFQATEQENVRVAMKSFIYEAERFLCTFFFFCTVLQMGVVIRILVTEGLESVLAQYKALYGRFYIFLMLHILFLLLAS